MEVNRELPNLADGLDESVHVIGPEGRVLVLAYHSLEDRMVKETFARWAGEDRESAPPAEAPRPEPARRRPLVRLLTRRPLRPRADEVAANRRAESARLRAVERLPELAHDADRDRSRERDSRRGRSRARRGVARSRAAGARPRRTCASRRGRAPAPARVRVAVWASPRSTAVVDVPRSSRSTCSRCSTRSRSTGSPSERTTEQRRYERLRDEVATLSSPPGDRRRPPSARHGAPRPSSYIDAPRGRSRAPRRIARRARWPTSTARRRRALTPSRRPPPRRPARAPARPPARRADRLARRRAPPRGRPRRARARSGRPPRAAHPPAARRRAACSSCVVFGVLAFRVAQLQVLSGDRYQRLALAQTAAHDPAAAPSAAAIFDRNGRDLAISIEPRRPCTPTRRSWPTRSLYAAKLAPVARRRAADALRPARPTSRRRFVVPRAHASTTTSRQQVTRPRAAGRRLRARVARGSTRPAALAATVIGRGRRRGHGPRRARVRCTTTHARGHSRASSSSSATSRAATSPTRERTQRRRRGAVPTSC